MTLRQLRKTAREAAYWRDAYLNIGIHRLGAVTRELKSNPKAGDLAQKACGAAAAAAELTLGYRVFNVQLLAAAALCNGNIIEMNTGEGKTLTAVMPAYFHAVKGDFVHIATANEYLAERDYNWMLPAYEALGVTAGLTLAGHECEKKQRAYRCDVLYATATELGFDYLRDGIVTDISQRVQRGLYRAIVDEADSILLDEATTPMILSSSGETGVLNCAQADTLVRYLKPRHYASFDEDAEIDGETADYIVDEKKKAVFICPEGVRKAQAYYRIFNLFSPENAETYHRVIQAMRAYGLMRQDIDYIVLDGRVRIVDRHTGRVMEGRRFSEGLHQAIEAKERAEIHPESDALATITYQGFFKGYRGVSGMTGTAWTARRELEGTFGAAVRRIPPNRPCIRIDREDVLCSCRQDKLEKLTKKAQNEYKSGRPVLIGTPSVEMSEEVSALLHRERVPHSVLNAKLHAEEAAIIKQAGKSGAVTVATNMAGRGTDILLGAGGAGESGRIRALGGLLVLGAERHHSGRVDEQLSGRAGRQGDPGESIFFIAPDDEVYRLHGGGAAKFSPRAFRRAQDSAEASAAAQRKRALEEDTVIQRQRKQILEFRERALTRQDLDGLAKDLIKRQILRLQKEYLPGAAPSEQEIRELERECAGLFGVRYAAGPRFDTAKELGGIYGDLALFAYEERAKLFGGEWEQARSMLLLHCIDRGWRNHLYALEELKKNRPLAEKGAASPANVFIKNSYRIYSETCAWIEQEYLFQLFHAKPS